MATRTVRPERTFERFSRGLELIRAILEMWRVHEKMIGRASGELINANIERIRERFDLTVEEWHYWAEIARGVG